jgi:hypothetical protein
MELTPGECLDQLLPGVRRRGAKIDARMRRHTEGGSVLAGLREQNPAGGRVPFVLRSPPSRENPVA